MADLSVATRQLKGMDLGPQAVPALSGAGITVHFGGIAALKGVDIDVRPGEVLGLVGANGAGKSTLVKVLAGAVPSGSYEGTLLRRGQHVAFGSPRDAEAAGIGIVPQELVGVPELTVVENIVLGRYLTTREGLIDWAACRAAAEAAVSAIGTSLPLDSRFVELSAASQQLVQLARVIHAAADVVLFDEPTSSLSPPEVAELFAVVRRMRNEGRAIVLITHRIAEIFEVCDRVQVLHDGSTAGIFQVATSSTAEIVRAMLGQEIAAMYPRTGDRRQGRAIFQVRSVSGLATTTSTAVHKVTFDIHEGEILGLFGLVGAGRTELLDLLFGIRPSLAGGSVVVDGKDVTNRSSHDRLNAGLGLVTEDRKRTGLVLGLPIHTNILMASLGQFARLGVMQGGRERAAASRLAGSLEIRTPSLDALVSSLSGGNQQKVVLAKWLTRKPRVLLLDEPTRGIDVGAKAEVFRILADLARNGMAILFVSSEVEEVAGFCDRALVMYRGAIVSTIERAQITEESLMRAATGVAA